MHRLVKLSRDVQVMSGAWMLRAGCRLAVRTAAVVQCKEEECHRGNTILERCYSLTDYRARCGRSHCDGVILPEAEGEYCGGECYMMGKATTGIHAEEYRAEWGIHLS